MNCPRCSEQLKPTKVANFTVQLCPNCEGSFYQGDQLFLVEELGQSELEKSDLAPVLVGDQLDKIDLDAMLDCPECGERMSRYNHLGDETIILDECSEHGIWLDDGEMGALLDFVQRDKAADAEAEAKREEIRERYQFESVKDMAASSSGFNPIGLVFKGLNRFFARERT